MAVGLKYWFRFKDEWDRYHCVQILKEGYSGAVTELERFGGVPVILTKPSDGTKFQPIQGKEIAIKLLSDSDMKFSEFFTANNRDYLIRYWIENQTNLITNGDFANWTADDPDSWDVSQEDQDNEVTDDSGRAAMISGGGVAYISISQAILTSIEPYHITFDINTVVAGTLALRGGASDTFTTTGSKDVFFNATGVNFGFKLTGTNDVTIDNSVVYGFDKIFEGFVTPDMYYEPFIVHDYEVTLRATDGLGDLKNKLFESAVDIPYTGQQDLLDVIEICLDETGIALDIISACNFFETTHNKADTDDPLPQTYINQEVYREDYKTGWNCYDVLTDIMNCIGAKLEQINGAWHIIPIRELAGSENELITNGNFAAWTGNDPDNWVVTGEVGTNPEISEVGSDEGHGGAGTGSCNIYTTGTNISIAQTIMIVGKTYLMSLNVTKVVAGSITLEGMTGAPIYSTTGIKTFTFEATATAFKIKRNAACDITIDDISVKAVSYDRRRYDSSGVYQSNDSLNPQMPITSKNTAEATLCAWQEGNQMLEIIPAYKEFTLLQNYGYRENIIENHSFEPDQWSDANTPLLWTKSTSGTWIRRYSDFAWMGSPAATIGAAKSIYQLPANAKLELAGSYTLQVIYKSKVIIGGTGYIEVKLDTGAVQRYLDDDGSWNAGVVYLNFTNTGLVEVELDTDAIPLDAANLTITCYEVVRGSPAGVAYDYLKIEVIPSSGAVYEKENKRRETISTNYNFIPSEKTINIGDLPGKNNEEVVYWGGLLNSSGVALSSWEHKGAADWGQLLSHTAADIENNHNAPTYKLRGTIHSKVMDFNTVIKEGNLSDKIFIPGQMIYYPKSGLWTGEWLEVVTN